MELKTKIVSAVIRSLKLPPRFRLKMVKEDPVRLELSLTPSYGKNPIIVGLVESLGGLLIDPSYKLLYVFLIYLIVVIYRPQGLFGR